MATTNSNFKVKNGLDAVGEISTLGNLYANKTTYGFSVTSAAPASITYWKIATLPATTGGTYDHIVLDAILDDDWGSVNKANAKILFGNRNAFTYRYYLSGTVRSASRVLAYTEANGTVSIYLRAGNGNYCTMSYNITHGIDNGTIIYKNPTSTTTTPTGTLSFDSSNTGTYVPQMYIPYTGQPVINGLVNSSGAVSGASFVKSGGTSSQFLKADGSVDSNTYLATTASQFVGHHPEGRIAYNAYLTNDMANARLRGATVSATQNGVSYSISNANWDAMFDGTASFFSISPTSGFTFPLVITVSLPRTLTYGTWVGIGFGNSGWRANSVTIEVFSLDSNSWVTVSTTTTNTSEDVFTAVSGLTNANATGINQVRYTLSNPNSTQLRIAHLWAYNFNSDMWSQTMMPRAGGTFYGAITVPDRITLKAVANAANQSNGLLLSNTSDAWQSGLYLKTDGSGNPRLTLLAPTGSMGEAIAIDSAAKVGIGVTDPSAQLTVVSGLSTRIAAIVRGASGQTADLLQVQDSSANILGRFNSSGQVGTSRLSVSPNASVSTVSRFFASASSATDIVAVVRGAASQTANLQEWQTSTPTTVASISSTGVLAIDKIDAISVSTTTADLFGNVTTGTVGIADGLTTGTLNIGNGTTSSTGRTININTNASGSITTTTNIGSSVLGGTINLFTGYPGVILNGTPLITTPATTGVSSNNLAISTGNTTTSGSSGAITIDVGTSASTAGIIYLGTGNASEVRIGRSGIVTTIQGDSKILNPLLSSISTVGGGGSEGGQINFARVTDGAQYWSIDSFGTTASPDLRFIENATERFKLVSGGAISINGSSGTTGQILASQGSGSAPVWTTPAAYSVAWSGFTSGYNYYSMGGSQSNGTNTLNNMTLVPFALTVATTFTKIGIMVNTGGVASTVRLGIYNSSNGIPSTRLLDAGTVATTTSSTLTLITINQTLQPGLYWLAAVNQGATCSSQVKGTGHVPMVPFFGSPANGTARGLQVTGVSGALPDPVGTLGMAATPFEVFLQL